MILNIVPARREGSHILASFTGPSGSGKTYTALLFSRGLVGENGRIGFLDTETGRGRLYADVTAYDYAELTPPFTPSRFIQAITEFEDHGVDVLIIDSASHEWEGVGGCHDMAEATNKQGLLKWAVAKAQHKKLVSKLLTSRMHIVTCLRAREKFTQSKDPNTGRDVILNAGFHEIQERNYIYEQTVSVLLLGGGKKIVTKCPDPLVPAFGPVGTESDGWLNQDTGAFVADWIKGGDPINSALATLRQHALEAAQLGTATYRKFFSGLSKADQKRLTLTDHENLKSVAAEADALVAAADDPSFPDDGRGRLGTAAAE